MSKKSQYAPKTACVHLYIKPAGKGRCNIYVDGSTLDLQALLISAARTDDNFYNALFGAADFIIRDEAHIKRNS